MKLLDMIKQYQNNTICEKWNNNIPLTEFSGGFLLNFACMDGLDSILESFSFLPADDITGALVMIGDGDYEQIYVTESSRPYDLIQAIYHPLSYYL